MAMTAACERPECVRDRQELAALHATWRGNPVKTFYFGLVLGFLPVTTTVLLLFGRGA